MKKIFFLLSTILIPSFGSLAQESKQFESIKGIIKNDLLEEEIQKKQEVLNQKKEEEHKKNVEKHNYPSSADFWNFVSEYWLVKNAQNLSWDFEKPDYGIEESTKNLMQSLGFYEKRIKIILVKSPNVPHFSLPTNSNNYIIILSLPFIRTMDLTKLEISLLVLEEMMRSDFSYFRNYVTEKGLEDKFGKNFFGEKVDLALIKKILSNYDFFIFKKGFSFQQQYELTQKMEGLLKSNIKMFNAYLSLLSKTDNLAKTNSLYSNYTKIYPSPEIQIKWLGASSGENSKE